MLWALKCMSSHNSGLRIDCFVQAMLPVNPQEPRGEPVPACRAHNSHTQVILSLKPVLCSVEGSSVALTVAKHIYGAGLMADSRSA
jgi:hypothetical protein